MTTTDPVTSVDSRFSVKDAPAVPWPDARRELEKAGTYWLATVRSDGRPHVTTLIAMWHGEALYFSTGPDEQKYKNLQNNPHCVVTTGTNSLDDGLDVVVEGDASRVTGEARLRALAAVWERKYGREWQLTAGEESAAHVFEVTPVKAFGFRKGFGTDGQGGQTRWRWERP
jgi:nitroimidazol reductase NimA-like FMN-containing flavoprotein (pyridoxamine 5'-phosphate oxidase superfamily)